MPILATRQAETLRSTFRRREEMEAFFESAGDEHGFLLHLAVATNPKTPQPLALSLIPTLRGADLRRLAKSLDLREAVRREVPRTVQRQH